MAQALKARRRLDTRRRHDTCRQSTVATVRNLFQSRRAAASGRDTPLTQARSSSASSVAQPPRTCCSPACSPPPGALPRALARQQPTRGRPPPHHDATRSAWLAAPTAAPAANTGAQLPAAADRRRHVPDHPDQRRRRQDLPAAGRHVPRSENPNITVKISPTDGTNYDQKLLTYIQAGHAARHRPDQRQLRQAVQRQRHHRRT